MQEKRRKAKRVYSSSIGKYREEKVGSLKPCSD
jgi:hypothetical protein